MSRPESAIEPGTYEVLEHRIGIASLPNISVLFHRLIQQITNHCLLATDVIEFYLNRWHGRTVSTRPLIYFTRPERRRFDLLA